MTLFYDNVLIDSGKFECADFKSDVCQLVSVEHFSRETFFMMAAKNRSIFNIVSLSALYKALFVSVIK